MPEKIRALIVEDSQDDATLMVLDLQKKGLATTHERVETAEQMKNSLSAKEWDIILCDYHIPNFGAMLS